MKNSEQKNILSGSLGRLAAMVLVVRQTEGKEKLGCCSCSTTKEQKRLRREHHQYRQKKEMDLIKCTHRISRIEQRGRFQRKETEVPKEF